MYVPACASSSPNADQTFPSVCYAQSLDKYCPYPERHDLAVSVDGVSLRCYKSRFSFSGIQSELQRQNRCKAKDRSECCPYVAQGIQAENPMRFLFSSISLPRYRRIDLSCSSLAVPSSA
jgi:hypothetical protein